MEKFIRLPRGGDDPESAIRRNLRKIKIVVGQFDLNGFCNAKCWYCPVKYEGNPKEFASQMPIDDAEFVLRRIRESKVAGNLRFLHTAHYNEILLYSKFDALLELLRKYDFNTLILSNGTPLVPERINEILEHLDVVNGITLNIPSLNPRDWSEKTGLPTSAFQLLLQNLDYLHLNIDSINVTVLVNSITEKWRGDLLERGILTPATVTRELVDEFKSRYPGFSIFLVDALTDRSGALEKARVLKNERAELEPGIKVVGCGHDLKASGSRIFGWLHVNSKGDVFLCCEDFHMKYKFGNIFDQALDEIWWSDLHVDRIIEAFGEICTRCIHHVVI